MGRLLVLECAEIRNKRAYWKCQCDCGNISLIASYHLIKNNTKSCGCLRSETIKTKNITHGMENTRFCKIWRNLLNRCKNKNTADYNYYGGRGIKVKWSSFEEFRDDMYDSYLEHTKIYGEQQTTLDRINNNGDYSKQNCRWSTRLEQGNNKRNNYMITIHKTSKTLSEWSRVYNIKRSSLSNRIHTQKMNPLEALTKPIRK